MQVFRRVSRQAAPLAKLEQTKDLITWKGVQLVAMATPSFSHTTCPWAQYKKLLGKHQCYTWVWLRALKPLCLGLKFIFHHFLCNLGWFTQPLWCPVSVPCQTAIISPSVKLVWHHMQGFTIAFSISRSFQRISLPYFLGSDSQMLTKWTMSRTRRQLFLQTIKNHS